jgi:hypothetical protein
MSDVIIIVLIVVMIIVFVLTIVFKGDLYKPDSDRFGTWQEPILDNCIRTDDSTGGCAGLGTRKSVRICDKNPDTGFGCLNQNLEQEINNQVTFQVCNPTCLRASFQLEHQEECVSFRASSIKEVKDFVFVPDNPVVQSIQPLPIRACAAIGSSFQKTTYVCVATDDAQGSVNGCKVDLPGEPGIFLEPGQRYTKYEPCENTQTKRCGTWEPCSIHGTINPDISTRTNRTDLMFAIVVSTKLPVCRPRGVEDCTLLGAGCVEESGEPSVHCDYDKYRTSTVACREESLNDVQKFFSGPLSGRRAIVTHPVDDNTGAVVYLPELGCITASSGNNPECLGVSRIGTIEPDNSESTLIKNVVNKAFMILKVENAIPVGYVTQGQTNSVDQTNCTPMDFTSPGFSNLSASSGCSTSDTMSANVALFIMAPTSNNRTKLVGIMNSSIAGYYMIGEDLKQVVAPDASGVTFRKDLIDQEIQDRGQYTHIDRSLNDYDETVDSIVMDEWYLVPSRNSTNRQSELFAPLSSDATEFVVDLTDTVFSPPTEALPGIISLNNPDPVVYEISSIVLGNKTFVESTASIKFYAVFTLPFNVDPTSGTQHLIGRGSICPL